MIPFCSDVGGTPPYPPGSFDRVLVDAPCSALGQRPSCQNKMTLTEVKSYSALQRKIFTRVSFDWFVNLFKKKQQFVYHIIIYGCDQSCKVDAIQHSRS